MQISSFVYARLSQSAQLPYFVFKNIAYAKKISRLKRKIFDLMKKSRSKVCA